MNILCVIGARGGSKGVKGKNIRDLLGKPMIAWSIEQAKECPLINKVVVSTDSIDIAKIAKNYKADVPFIRPKSLAKDSSGKWEVWQHALTECERLFNETYDIFVDLDCTSPLREIDDINKAISLFQKSNVDAVFSICESRKNPYFNMVEYENNHLKVVKEREKLILCRQNAPIVYDHVASIYVVDPNYLKKAKSLLEGNVIGYDIGVNKGIDLDTEFDYEIIKYLMSKKYSNFDK